MMIKKVNSKTTRLIGLVSVLLLLTAAVFVGGAAAAEYKAGSSADLLDAISMLDQEDEVEIELTDSFGLTEADTKNIVAKLVNVFINQNYNCDSGNKYLWIDFEGQTISAMRNGKSITLKGTGSGDEAEVRLSATKSNKTSVLAVSEGKLTGTFTYNGETVTLEDVSLVDVTLEYYPVNDDAEYAMISVSSDPSVAAGILKIKDEAFTIKDFSVNKQKIIIDANVDEKHAAILPYNGNAVTGTVKINEGTFELSSNNFSFEANYNSAISATGMVNTGTVYYTPNGGKKAEVKLTNVVGNYGEKTKLSGVVTLMDDHLKLTRHIPVPSFVEDGYLNLNGRSLTINSDGKILSNTPKNKITITSTGKFNTAVLDSANFEPANGFKWAKNNDAIVIDGAVIDLGEIQDIYSTIPVILTKTSKKPDVGNIYSKWKVGLILASFDLEAVGDFNEATVVFELTKPASNPKVFHNLGGENWEVLDVKSEGDNKYSFKTTSMSPFTIAEATYVGGGGGGGGGGSSTIPTYTPGVTPTPTQTWTPIDPSQTGVQPSQSPKSPMPVFGILAGLGAAALAGVVLRRK